MRKSKVVLANVIHIIGWLLTLFIIFYLVLNDFILLDVEVKVKITFIAYMTLFILFLIFGKHINKWIQRRLQSIDTANELGQIAKTPALVIEFLKMFQVIFPLLLVGAMFGLVAVSLVGIGFVVLKIAGALTIPIVSGTIKRSIINKEKIRSLEDDKKAQAKMIADEVSKRRIGYR